MTAAKRATASAELTTALTSGQGVTTHADHGANKQPDRKESATKKSRVALGAVAALTQLSLADWAGLVAAAVVAVGIIAFRAWHEDEDE